jgi:hypothetical protein
MDVRNLIYGFLCRNAGSQTLLYSMTYSEKITLSNPITLSSPPAD